MIENAIYTILKELTKDKADGVYLDFVNDSEIDKEKTYIVYSLTSSTPHYEFEYGRNVYQIAVYSNDLSKALNIRRVIGKYFTNLTAIIDDTEICGCSVSNETHNRQETKADNDATEIKQGNKTIRREKKGLWEIETITL